ncbi:MAG TPA: serine/threonine protein kinase [Arenimonas sp.]|nr:serine/threonine protein kinase [Arenimonas sp.]
MTRAVSIPPFAGLDPECILAAVESLGLLCDGRVLTLNSFENRVYRIGIEDGAPLVAKFYRPGRWSDAAIQEEHAFAGELRDAELSVVAPLAVGGATLHRFEDFRFALFPLQGGQAPEPGHKETLIQIGRALGRLHAIGSRAPFSHRLRMSVASHAEEPVDYLLDAGWLPPDLEENFMALSEALIEAIEDVWQSLPDVRVLRLHGDCHPGNILWRYDTPHFVDLDDALTGPAMQDLWMLLSGDAGARGQQMGWLLEGYEVFCAFDPRELRLIEALRGMRLLSYHAWIARRWGDPAFPAAFPWFESPRHWEGVISQMQEQLDALAQPAIKLP